MCFLVSVQASACFESFGTHRANIFSFSDMHLLKRWSLLKFIWNQPYGAEALLNLTQHNHIDHIWKVFPLYEIASYVAVNLNLWLLRNRKIHIWRVFQYVDSFYDFVGLNRNVLRSHIDHIWKVFHHNVFSYEFQMGVSYNLYIHKDRIWILVRHAWSSKVQFLVFYWLFNWFIVYLEVHFIC